MLYREAIGACFFCALDKHPGLATPQPGTARKIQSRWAGRVYQKHGASHKSAVDLRHALVMQKPRHGGLLQGRRQQPQRGQVQALLRIEDTGMLESPGENFPEFIGGGGCSGQHDRRIPAGDGGKQWQGIEAQAVAHGRRFAVAGILAPAVLAGEQPRLQVGAAQFEEGAVQFQDCAAGGGDGLQRAHAFEAV